MAEALDYSTIRQNCSHAEMFDQFNADLIVPNIKSWRPYIRDDFLCVASMMRSCVTDLFGDINLEDSLEMSENCIVVENSDDEIIACICLRNYWNMPAILPEHWEEVLLELYGLRDFNSENSLFVHLLIWDLRYDWTFLSCVLKSLYLHRYRLDNVIFTVQPNCNQALKFNNYLLGKYFIKVLPKRIRKKAIINSQVLYISFRHRVAPPIRVRFAVAEDNDDLVAILDRTSPELRKQYGDFYIAEIVLDQLTTRQIIVAECNNEAVGMLCLDTNISMKHLKTCYEVYPYRGFCKLGASTVQMRYTDSAVNLSDKPSTQSTLYVPVSRRSEMVKNRFHFEGDSEENSVDIESGSSSDQLLALLNRRLSSTPDLSNVYDSEQSTESSSDTSIDNRKILKHRMTHTFELLTEETTGNDAFIIELYGMRADFEEQHATMLVDTAFEIYPELNYCLIGMPAETAYFPMLDNFTKVVPRAIQSSTPNTIVYCTQRNSLYSRITVRVMTTGDVLLVANFTEHMYNGTEHADSILAVARRLEEQREVFVEKLAVPYIIFCKETVIGMCVLQSSNALSQLQRDFNVDTLMVCAHHNHFNRVCDLQMMILHPSFMPRVCFIQAELYRLSGFSCMFYKLYESSNVEMAVNTMLVGMSPVLPRRKMKQMEAEAHATGGAPSNRRRLNYALYHQNISMCGVRKVPIHHRIVVVGCSTTAMAFLEWLIFRLHEKYVYFSSLTLISPTGLAAVMYEDISELAKSFYFERQFTPDYNRKLGFPTWINIVYETTTKWRTGNGHILPNNPHNSQQNCVMVGDNRQYFYDRLYIFCGLQFDYPIKLKVPPKQPKNVVFMNNALEAELMLLRLKQIRNSRELQIIVYGDIPECYSCINMILQSGVDSSLITFIRPKLTDLVGGTNIFNDNFVDNLLGDLLAQSNVKMLNNYEVVDWKLEKNNTVSFISVQSDLDVLELPCMLLVSFERKIVMRRTIQVLNEAGLVFDGRLVINADYQATDPKIYAGGPMTKYKAVMYSKHLRHEFFYSQEIGARLARKLFDDVNPGRSYTVKPRSHQLKGTVHISKNPVVSYHMILDGYNFLCIRAPGQPIPYEIQIAQPSYGIDLVTANYRASGSISWGQPDVRYCRVQLDEHNIIKTIVCLTREKLNVHRFIAVWGLHESILGHLRLRYDLLMIPDLIKYLVNPGTSIVFHDRYQTHLNDQLMRMMFFHKDRHLNLTEMSKDCIVKNNWQNLTEPQRALMLETITTTTYADNIRAALLSFVDKNADALPMYFNALRKPWRAAF